jgi:hypothetical protein
LRSIAACSSFLRVSFASSKSLRRWIFKVNISKSKISMRFKLKTSLKSWVILLQLGQIIS